MPSSLPPQNNGIIQPSFPDGLTVTPPHMPGLTNSVPVNLATGSGVIGASNALTNGAGGNQITFPSLFIGILWHILFPKPSGIWPHLLLLIAAGSCGIILFLIVGHLEPVEAVTRSFGMAAQSWLNNFGLKVGGFDSLNKGEVT